MKTQDKELEGIKREFENNFGYHDGAGYTFCCGGDYCDGMDDHDKEAKEQVWSFIEHALDEARKEEREKIKRELIKTKIIDTGLDKVIENMGGAPLGNRSTK